VRRVPLWQANFDQHVRRMWVQEVRRAGPEAPDGWLFNTLVRLLAVRGFQDTQAGFKCFKREAAREMFPYQTMDGWGFDVEILFIAQKCGYRIVEVPIN